MTPVVFTNIYKSFGTPPKYVLEDINLTLPSGITCLMGASGIGKTTLAYILAGILNPDSGMITGREGKKISFVFQEDRLLESETTLTNVLFVTPSAKKYAAKARALLTQAELGESINKKASELSGGMKRRVALCRALIAEHDILILDEPFKGLDEETKPKIIKMVLEHTTNKIVLCITHDITETDMLKSRLIRIPNHPNHPDH
jgi:NitT/TauT family transport system ATP-binding protein